MKTKVTGDFYREDAARIASQAARLNQQPAQEAERAPEAPPPYVPPVLLGDPQRPLLTPDPPINQNAARREPDLGPPLEDARSAERRRPTTEDVYEAQERYAEERYEADERPRPSVLRIIAWIVIAPLYVGVALASIGVDVLFVKDLLEF